MKSPRFLMVRVFFFADAGVSCLNLCHQRSMTEDNGTGVSKSVVISFYLRHLCARLDFHLIVLISFV